MSHFQRLQSKMAQTQTWKKMKPEAFCAAVEQHIEAEFLEKETEDQGKLSQPVGFLIAMPYGYLPEEQISGRCHKLLRKLGRAMRLGWEWELLDLDQDSSNVSQAELRHVLQRLQSLGPQKQVHRGGRQGRQRAQIFVTGKVQGVYYRDTSKLMGNLDEQSKLLRDVNKENLEDGRVEILAEGPQEKLKEMVEWCWKGPEGAKEVGLENSLTAKRKVTDVQVTYEEAKGGLPSPFSNAGRK
eukprot:s687_g5.t1